MTLETRISLLENRIRQLENERRVQKWVSVSVISKLTGWKFRDMAKAREQGLVKYRENKNGGYEYLLSSIDKVFIKNN